MNHALAIGMPGPFELIIIAAMIGVPIALVVLIVWLITRRK
jgi:hypothetical protein